MDLRDEVGMNLTLIRAVIAMKSDGIVKKVGNKVIVHDGTANRDKDGVSRNGIDPLFKEAGVVIEDSLELEFEWKRLDVRTVYLMDILVRFPGGEEVYTCSNMTRCV